MRVPKKKKKAKMGIESQSGAIPFFFFFLVEPVSVPFTCQACEVPVTSQRACDALGACHIFFLQVAFGLMSAYTQTTLGWESEAVAGVGNVSANHVDRTRSLRGLIGSFDGCKASYNVLTIYIGQKKCCERRREWRWNCSSSLMTYTQHATQPQLLLLCVL